MPVEEYGKIDCGDFENAIDVCVREAPVIAGGIV
jgi:hypothetical protein